jgi:SAM-dependent methyltransferase
MTTDLPASSPTLMQRVRALRDARSIASQEIRRGLREVVTPLDICGTVLDVGAGRAPWRDLVPYAERYIAFDVTPLNEVQFVGSVTDLPVRDGAVELAFCTEVLEHVDDTAAALSELNRVLQPGGYLVLTTPLMWGVHDRIDYYRWTAEGLRRILREHGFRMLRLRRPTRRRSRCCPARRSASARCRPARKCRSWPPRRCRWRSPRPSGGSPRSTCSTVTAGSRSAT